MVLAFILISIISLALSGFLSMMNSGHPAAWMTAVHHGGVFVVYAMMFSILFRWMPDGRVNWSPAIYGGILTSVLFILGKILIGMYLGHAAIASSYGAAGSAVVLLLWAYYSSIIVLFGAEIVARAIVKPIRTIAENCGVDGAVIADEVLTRGEKSPNIGYDANTGDYVDMFKAGIIDPLVVTKSALSNAASIAGLMLTTEVMITKIDEDDKKSKVAGSVA